MDNQTILDIIKIIDAKENKIENHFKTIPQHNQDEIQYWNGILDAYLNLKLELESLIK